MASREYRSSWRCAEPGCRDVQFMTHSTRRDEADAYRRQHEKPYRCTRHAHPEQNLRPGNEHTRHVLTAVKVQSGRTGDGQPIELPGLFWRAEGAGAGSGFTFGPGFTAHASDFPEGTRLVVTAQIETPAKDGTDA
jgi:hypothetical protein